MGDACTPDFVSISENGTHFEVNGAPFFFAGCNTYYMMARAPLHIAMLSVTQMSLTWSEACPTRASSAAVPSTPCESTLPGILLGAVLMLCRRVQRIQASGMKSQRSWTRLKRQSLAS